MSTIASILRSRDRHARRAIGRGLLRLAQQILAMRNALTAGVQAEAAIQRLDPSRLTGEHAAQAAQAARPGSRAGRPSYFLDDLVALTPSGYEVRLFDREYGDLDDVVVVESFPQAVQLAADRLCSRPEDRAEAKWTGGAGSLTVRTLRGHGLVCIQAVDKPMPTVRPLVARACQALVNGDPSLTHQLFTALRRVA